MPRSFFALVFLVLSAAVAFSSPRPVKEKHEPTLLQQVKEYIGEQLQVSQTDLTLEILKTHPDALGGKIKILPMTSLPKRGGIATLPLDQDGKRAYATVHFSVYYPVVVLREHVRAGEALSGKVDLEKKDAQFLPWDACRYLDRVQDKESRFDLQAGEVLVPRDYTDLQLVHSGDLCSILVEKGLVEIHAQGQALGSGGAGTLISVRLLENNKTISAVVVDRGVVALKLPEF